MRDMPRSVTVDGKTITVLPFEAAIPVTGEIVVRVAMVSDTVDELYETKTIRDALVTLLESVQRRGLQPAGVWLLGYLPVDDPGWDSYLEAEIGRKVAAKLKEINGHVRLFMLTDSATAEPV